MARHLITSALPYVNGAKHLGNLIGSLLPADVAARHLRRRGHDVFFLCATDEHGTVAELGAQAEGAPSPTTAPTTTRSSPTTTDVSSTAPPTDAPCPTDSSSEPALAAAIPMPGAISATAAGSSWIPRTYAIREVPCRAVATCSCGPRSTPSSPCRSCSPGCDATSTSTPRPGRRWRGPQPRQVCPSGCRIAASRETSTGACPFPTFPAACSGAGSTRPSPTLP